MAISQNFADVFPTLNLNFAGARRLDPRINFSRSSTGTYTGPDGLIKTAGVNEARFDHDPVTGASLGLLIEESRTNLLTYSSNFVSDWGGGLTVTQYSAIAPDGTQTAALIQRPANSGNSSIFAHPSLSQNTNYCYSCFIKLASTPDTTYSICSLSSTNSQISPSYASIAYNFATGAIATMGSLPTTSGVIAYPNGWYRLYMVINTSTQTNASLEIRPLANDNVSNFYIWGAQLEAGSFPTSYIPTPATFTSRSSTATYYDSTGTIQTAAINEARSNAYFPDSNGVMRPAGLLLEAAGTNLFTNSNPWSGGSGITWNSSQGSPTGGTEASKMIENTSTGIHGLVIDSGGYTANFNTTFSFFAKPAGRNRISWWMSLGGSYPGVDSPEVVFDLSTGTVTPIAVTDSRLFNFNITKFPNGWYRCSIYVNPGSTINRTTYLLLDNGSSRSYTGDGISGILLFGLQKETGSFPTSYIPTSGSTVTRAADVSSSATVTRSADVAQMTGTNFSSWFNQSASTIIVNCSLQSPASSGQAPIVSVDASGLNFRGISRRSAQGARNTSNNDLIDLTSPFVWNGENKKIGITWVSNDCVLVDNGILVGTDNSTISPLTIVDRMLIGSVESGGFNAPGVTISRLTYYPKRLTDAQLQFLTAN